MLEVVTLVGGTNDGVHFQVNTIENIIVLTERLPFPQDTLKNWLEHSSTYKNEFYYRQTMLLSPDIVITFFAIEGMDYIAGIKHMIENYKGNKHYL